MRGERNRSGNRSRYARVFVLLVLVFCVTVVARMAYRNFAETRYREGCGASLKSIGQALQMYAQAHGESFPDSFQTLAHSDRDLGIAMFLCPSTREYHGASLEARLIDVLNRGAPRVSYQYSGSGLTTASPSGAVLAFEPPENHGGGINVLFVDGHIEFLEQREMQNLIAELQAGHNPPRPGMLK